MKSTYGRHCSSIPDALTLFELGGRISTVGHALGCQVFSQFPPTYRAGRKGETIDYVWAVRRTDHSDRRRWHVLAAFECEGLDVPDDSLGNDVSKLIEVGGGLVIPTAVVLYRTCEDGSLFWRPARDWEAKQRYWLDFAKSRLAELCARRGVAPIPAVLDNELGDALSHTMQVIVDRVRSRIDVLADAGT
ncbi:MAG TPA: hypothetical protein VGL61_31510 [Kofleriaceae bacterium]